MTPQRARLTIVRPTRPAVRELRQPSRTEGSVWRRGYDCGREDRVWWRVFSTVAVMGYVAIGAAVAVLTKGLLW